MFRLPYVPRADDLIEKAFSRGADKAKAQRSTRKGMRDVRMRMSEENRITSINAVIKSDLNAIIDHFPSYDQLPVFHQRLLDLKVEKDNYKKSLGAVQWCADRVQKLEGKVLPRIKKTRTTSSHMKEFLGRTASFIKQISAELDTLVAIKSILLEFPVVEDIPTLVVAGYPNVGKSTFMKNLTGSNVKVASYPFTTQDILIGHTMIRYTKYQIIDTPGILDRPMSERNNIELQAILALSELADAIVFIFDPTQDEAPQINLMKEIEEGFGVPVTVVINKSDAAGKVRVEELRSKMGVPKNLAISSLNAEECRSVFEHIFIQQKTASG
jgi:nucleolar GTP-binding protein